MQRIYSSKEYSILFFIVGHLSIYAQANHNLYFRALRTQEGLSESTNAFISRDSRDYIWISSGEGINRFDGHSTKIYASNDQNSNSVRGETGQSRFWEDSNGNLWFCTYTAINCYLRKKDCFRSWVVDPKYNTDYSIIHLSRSGQLWFIANNDLYTCKINNLMQQNPLNFRPVYATPSIPKDKKFLVKTNTKGELEAFFSYRNFEGGMHYWQKTGHNRIHVKPLLQHNKNVNLNIKQILQSRTNNDHYWLITSDGLYQYSFKNDLLIEGPIQVPKEGTKLNSGLFISNQVILIASTEGILVFDLKSRGFIPLSSHSTLYGKSIHELYLDKKNILWASVFGEGLFYANLKGLKFEFLSSFEKVVGIVEESKDKIWAVHENGSLKKYQQKNLVHKVKISLPKSVPRNAQGITIVTGLQEVYRLDPTKNRWFTVFNAKPNWNLSAQIKPNGRAMLLCTSNGIMRLNFSETTIAPFDSLGAFRSSEISDLFFDPVMNQYFLSHNDEEIWIYRQTSKTWNKWKTIPLNANFNHHTFIHSLNEYWIANSKGVLCINRYSGKSYWLSNQYGVIRQNIQSVTVDTIGSVWLVSNFKLLQYDLATKTTQTYSRDDGLFAGQFSDGAITTTHSGEIWIGGKNGINIFNPKNIKANPNLAQIALQEFKINDSPIRDRSPNEIKNLTLPWHQNNLFFHLVAIEYTAPKNNQLEYQLKGWEKSANLAGPTASVKYNRLTPGKYTLRVRAANNNGIWSPWQEKMKLEIRPPFWQTLWFQILATLLLLGLSWGAIQLYIRAKLQKERFLSAQKDARIKEQQRILREVHDDLGSNLTSIQQLRRKATLANPHGANGDFEAVCDLSVELFSRLGEVIVNLDEGPIPLNQLLQKLERHSKRYLNIQNNIDTIIEIPTEIPTLELSNVSRQHLELMVKECLHNIVKHAQASQVKLQFQFVEKLYISVQDNGVGIEDEKINATPDTAHINWQKQGNGLRNLQARASEMGGSITWQNLNPGTLVCIEVPLPK